MILTPLDERFIRELLARFHGNECLWTLAPFLVGDGGNTAFENVGVCNDHRLEGYTGNVFAA